MRFERWAVLWLFVWTAAPAAFAQDEPAKSIVYRDAIVVRETLERIMARPEFRRLAEKPEAEASGENPSWLERLFEWLEELLASEPEADATRSFAGVNYLVYALAAALLIVVLAFIFKTVVSTHRQKSSAPEDARALIVQAGAAPGETPPEQYWARAETLEAQKDYKGAIRELLLGANLEGIQQRRARRFRRHNHALDVLHGLWEPLFQMDDMGPLAQLRVRERDHVVDGYHGRFHQQIGRDVCGTVHDVQLVLEAQRGQP